MPFWLLDRKFGDYDEVQSVVVRAAVPSQARMAAYTWHGNEAGERDDWLDPARSTCVAIPSDGPDAVVHSHLLHG